QRWTTGKGLTAKKAIRLANQMGVAMYDAFIGKASAAVLQRVTPTAVLLDVDETILNLPWELLFSGDAPLVMKYPFGRLVTTRTLPRAGRDPIEEDTSLRILAVVNPTDDLASSERELIRLKEVAETYPGLVKLDVLTHDQATLAAFRNALDGQDYDILHFTGHAQLDTTSPGESGLYLTDGRLSADDVMNLGWAKPPYVIFNNACESGRAVAGRRLVDGEKHSNGLASAFLTCGVYAYIGYFWPVSDPGAALFSETFYRQLFETQNVGIAFLHARQRTAQVLLASGDLTGLQAILIGDAASAHRRDLATMAK
ncbi:MAG TPA: CHAT domain-containing protein, partial [Anaerolinea sp.]|nr:CHAT domain-containing protein [Anaerolinea sp.]